jgi:hypothetical protein
MGKEKNTLSLKKVIGQCKICFNKVIWFLKIPISLNRRLAAQTCLAVGEFLLVAKSKEEFLKLQEF